MPCQLCLDFRSEYPLVEDDGHPVHVIGDGLYSDPIICAFEVSEWFCDDNWCCQTMKALRDIFDREDPRRPAVRHNDSWMGILPIPGSSGEGKHQCGFLCLGWYKNLGKTEVALVVAGTETEPLRRATALAIINEPQV
jgi:hypothetical protein